MLLGAMVTIHDHNLPNSGAFQKRPLKSWLLTKKIGDAYFVCVKNSVHPTCINYQMVHLERVHNRFVSEGKLGLLFRQPKHMVTVRTDDVNMLKLFLNQIQDIVSGKDVKIGFKPMPKTMSAKKTLTNFLDPMTTEFVAFKRFDQRILNMKHLNKLVLENCVLSNIPVQIGDLPIMYISLSGSKLGATQYDRDTLWDWMSRDKISNTLTTLKMDSVGLKTLPFEIMFLRKLQTLSVNRNELTYLPQYTGELKKLHTLCVADNIINYFPDSLFTRTFIQLDISNNPFTEHDTLQLDHVCKYNMQLQDPSITRLADQPVVKSLSQISFSCLMENRVKFKRQDIPRSLWHYFNVAGRCVHCDEFSLPDYTFVRHIVSFPEAHSLIKNHATEFIQWQSLICRFKCNKRQRKTVK